VCGARVRAGNGVAVAGKPAHGTARQDHAKLVAQRARARRQGGLDCGPQAWAVLGVHPRQRRGDGRLAGGPFHAEQLPVPGVPLQAVGAEVPGPQPHATRLQRQSQPRLVLRQRRLRLALCGHVRQRRQYLVRATGHVAPEQGTGTDCQLPPVPGHMLNVAGPFVVACQNGPDLGKRRSERLQQVSRRLPNGLRRCPAVQSLAPLRPEADKSRASCKITRTT